MEQKSITADAKMSRDVLVRLKNQICNGIGWGWTLRTMLKIEEEFTQMDKEFFEIAFPVQVAQGGFENTPKRKKEIITAFLNSQKKWTERTPEQSAEYLCKHISKILASVMSFYLSYREDQKFEKTHGRDSIKTILDQLQGKELIDAL